MCLCILVVKKNVVKIKYFSIKINKRNSENSMYINLCYYSKYSRFALRVGHSLPNNNEKVSRVLAGNRN